MSSVWIGPASAMRVRVGNPRSLAPSLGGTGFLPSSSSILPKGEESTCEVRLPYKERTANAIEGNHIGTWMDGQMNVSCGVSTRMGCGFFMR